MHWIICGEGLNQQIICLETGTRIYVRQEPQKTSVKYWYELTIIGVSGNELRRIANAGYDMGERIKIVSDKFSGSNKHEQEAAEKQTIEALEQLVNYLRAKRIENILKAKKS